MVSIPVGSPVYHAATMESPDRPSTDAAPSSPGSPAKAPRSAAKRSRSRIPLSEYPAWVSAITGIVAVLVAAIGVTFTAIQVLGDDPPAATPIVIKPSATISRVVVDGAEIRASGDFSQVDLDAEVILFIGRPEETDGAPWLPVEATTEPPAAGAAGSRVNGIWGALRPLTETGAFVWQVLVVPAGSGASDGYADIRARGADSDLVLAASEPFRTGE